MLCSSSSYVASVQRTAVIKSPFSHARTASQGARAQVAGLMRRGRTTSTGKTTRKRQEKELRSR